MMTSLRTRGAELGITFCERPLLANSRLAIEAAEYARDKGLHSAFSEKVFQAYFTYGRNIGELDVILDVAAVAGMDRDEVRRILTDGVYAPKRVQIAEEAKRLRIDSVPTFIINDRHQLVGAQPNEAFRKLFGQLERG
jgi:predicted DsbA family dithiol-disulfide isomerase